MKFLNQVIKALIENRQRQADAYRQGYRYYY